MSDTSSHHGESHVGNREERKKKRQLSSILLVLVAVMFGSSMDCIARFLQQGGQSIHPFQIIVARMGVTCVMSCLAMWFSKVEDFPLGKPGVRKWLLLRAFSGYAGLYCLYFSIHYLPLAEATVIRFLVPLATAILCSKAFNRPFTNGELGAGLVAIAGIVLIAHPTAIFGEVHDIVRPPLTSAGEIDEVTPKMHLISVLVSIIGVGCAAVAYTTIKVIGEDTHALISVNYFAFMATVTSTFALLVVPGIGFTMPQGQRQWILLVLMGVFGFLLQLLLTMGMQREKGSKSTSMLYVQVIFALALDWGIWSVIPGAWSMVGGSIVLISTIWSAMQKSEDAGGDPDKNGDVDDEETALLGAITEGGEVGVKNTQRNDS
ncbi:hypothetical protein BJ878DRAFT_296053 [Calycina marina]|uniref:EamA domain-containing protein n=1 Tax=Calycina marina TaxID=1763456 RepID=A0A9P7YVC6_9HELO|nr:hypothetical protein BJ878DRAFT_296053 [Calycina marina]